MRYIKMIVILWVLFFYSNVVQPSSGQIVITINSIGGHRSAVANMCAPQEAMWCYRSNVFSLALPKDGFKLKTWTYSGFRYDVKKQTKLALLGNELEVLEILQSRGAQKVMRFVYSPERGLISFQAAQLDAPTFLSEGRCGLGAPDSCNE